MCFYLFVCLFVFFLLFIQCQLAWEQMSPLASPVRPMHCRHNLCVFICLCVCLFFSGVYSMSASLGTDESVGLCCEAEAECCHPNVDQLTLLIIRCHTCQIETSIICHLHQIGTAIKSHFQIKNSSV